MKRNLRSTILSFIGVSALMMQTVLAVGVPKRISVASDGTQGNNALCSGVAGGSSSPSISADGRFVAFESCSTNLGPTEANGFTDIYAKDLQTGAVTLVSFGAISGSPNQTNSSSQNARISGDGRFVVFDTRRF